MEIDTLLRETITERAERAGMLRRIGELAPEARRRARRRRNRQLLTSAAAVLAVAAAGVVVTPHLTRPTVEGSWELAAAGYALPEFPYTPGWIPDGVADPHVSLHSEVPRVFDREVVVEHEAEGEPLNVVIQMRFVPADERNGEPPWEDVAVRGVPGMLTDDGDWLAVAWPDPSGQLVQVGASERAVGRDALLRYVEELTEEPLPVTPPVSLAVTPAGAEVTIASAHFMQLETEAGRKVTLMVHDPAFVDGLRADLRAAPDYVLPPPVPVEVAGQPAEVVDVGGDRLALSIQITPEIMLTIEAVGQDEEWLLTFGAGATITPYARPAPFR